MRIDLIISRKIVADLQLQFFESLLAMRYSASHHGPQLWHAPGKNLYFAGVTASHISDKALYK